MLIWGFYFLAAWGLSYIVGIAEISLSLRILLAGLPERPAVPEERVPDLRGQLHVVRPAMPEQMAQKPLIPVVGPWLVDLLECPMCLGFWIGVAASFWLPMLITTNPVLWSLAVGCATTGANFVILHATGPRHG